MKETSQLEHADIQAAARRLGGHLIATPLIGGLRLPGFEVPPDLRLKPELLQPGGTLHFRGALHYLLRQLGRLKGLVFWGEPRSVLASALAGQTQRLPMASFWDRDPGPDWRSQLTACGCSLQVQEGDPAAVAQTYAEERGFHLLPPDSADPDLLLGLATVGLELADQLPRDWTRVAVAGPVLAAALQAGLRASGHEAVVTQVTDCDVPPGLQQALRLGHRLDSDPDGLPPLAWALEHADQPTCAVL